LKELNQMKIQAMAEMDAQEELEDDEGDRLRVGHGAAAPTVRMDVDEMDVESLRDEQENHDSVDNDKVSRDAVAPVTQKGVSSRS
jgi:hypothetical protein